MQKSYFSCVFVCCFALIMSASNSLAVQWDLNYRQLLSAQESSDVVALQSKLSSRLRVHSDSLQYLAQVNSATQAILIETAQELSLSVTLLTQHADQYFLYYLDVGRGQSADITTAQIVRPINQSDFDKIFNQLFSRQQSPPSKAIDQPRKFTWTPGYVGVISLSGNQGSRQFLLSQDDFLKLSRSTVIQDLVGTLSGGGHYYGGLRAEDNWATTLVAQIKRLPTTRQGLLQQELLMALQSSDEQKIQVALARGADINGFVDNGATLLSWAIMNDKPQVAQRLAMLGADPTRKNFFGDSSGQALARVSLANALVANSASAATNRQTLIMRKHSPQTPAQRCQLLLDILWNDATVDLASDLVTQAISPNCATATGITVTMLAAGNASADMLKTVIGSQNNVNAVNASGTTALMYAASAMRLENVQLLLTSKANANVKDSQGDTALSMAKQQGAASVIRLLEKAQ
jgi:Ankyrin repeats (3 copies)